MVGTGKCFLVTGPPGVGKSTLIMRVFESLKASNPTLKVQGFYTLRVAGERVGFEVVTLDGRTCPLASSNFSSQESHRWPNVGKYKVDVASFESLALLELQVSLLSCTAWHRCLAYVFFSSLKDYSHRRWRIDAYFVQYMAILAGI
ncbi:cancer-related nucleoside-triphosphatase-like protein [Medicago truncatula]|uniref:Cancer-related nucleoside-triphosphatase-like protein n=1 Tax=Medicago truncatula TaxID=3880 RepID=A0A072UCU6_MEDTR|nr:cancer-related nucleoside-triphosphatase-like protein [Medicago truncatula]